MKKIMSLFLMILCIFSMMSFVYAADPTPDPKNQMDVKMFEKENPDVGEYKVKIGVLTNENLEDTSKDLLGKYKTGISIVSGCGALTMLLFFVLNFAKLGKSSGNPQMRQSAMMGVIFTGIGTLLLAGIMTFFTFFYNFLG